MKKYNITVNGKEYEVEVEEATAGEPYTPKAAPVTLENTPAAPVKKEESVQTVAGGGIEGAEKITSPMPGTILKVNVTVGQQVKKGDVLCVLEAMKMENDIVSPSDGKIAGVSVSKGSTVDSGDLLISLN